VRLAASERDESDDLKNILLHGKGGALVKLHEDVAGLRALQG